jgi:arylsulfatase A-like enzyme
MVQSLDENVGRLLDTLDELKLADSTIIVFFSDNGGNMYNRVDGIPPTSNAPLRGGKATLYEGGTREPCIVVWPGKTKPGSRSDALLSSVDWMPTLLDMTGVKPKPEAKFDGVNQTPALLGTGMPRDTVFCHFPHYTPATGALPATWVRRGDWKLIRFFCDSATQADRFELYNLKDDIGETKNLAAEQPELVRELNTLIDGFLKTTGAIVPSKNPHYDPAAKAPPEGKPVKKPAPKKPVQPKPPATRIELEKLSDETVVCTDGSRKGAKTQRNARGFSGLAPAPNSLQPNSLQPTANSLTAYSLQPTA